MGAAAAEPVGNQLRGRVRGQQPGTCCCFVSEATHPTSTPPSGEDAESVQMFPWQESTHLNLKK